MLFVLSQYLFTSRVVLIILVDDVNYFQTFWCPKYATYYYLQKRLHDIFKNLKSEVRNKVQARRIKLWNISK